MCGIAGLANLRAPRQVEVSMLDRMAAAIARRGPDDHGSFCQPGVGLASRRLSTVGLHDGRQPIFNEDRSVVVVFNGVLFDYPEQRAELSQRGHHFSTSTDTEVLVHLWEEHGEAMFGHLTGQFAFALFDTRRRLLILARDRLGIAPLHWAVRDDWLYFGSEIKALLASGRVQPEPDLKGIDHAFTCLGLGTRRTTFRDVSALLPGTYLRVDLSYRAHTGITEHAYWQLAFPTHADEYERDDDTQLASRFGELFDRAVTIRLRGDVPVAGYLSGGVDSSSVMASATRSLGRALPCYTIRIPDRRLDETGPAFAAADRIGAQPTIVECGRATLCSIYPQLVTAAEAPVLDTSAAALYRQAQQVHSDGFKVVLTGEGGDEALAGYPWLKTGKALGLADVGTTLRVGNLVRKGALVLGGARTLWPRILRFQDQLGGPNGLLDFYCLLYLVRSKLYSSAMLEQLGDFAAFDDLVVERAEVQRYHPLNRGLYLGYKTLLPGLLLSLKGDRPAMHNGVEMRPPLLDDALVAFCTRLPPRLKLRGLRRDKHLLRLYARRVLPASIADRPKAIFKAPFADTFLVDPPRYVEELLSERALTATGYFDPERVRRCRASYAGILNPLMRVIHEIALGGVVATQLWHHTFMGGGLCSLAPWTPPLGHRVDATMRS